MSDIEIWNKYGQLIPLKKIKTPVKQGEVAAIIVNRDRPDLTNKLVDQIKTMSNIDVDIYVVEMGSTKRSKHETIYYEDENYRGKCFGHNVGLRQSMQKKKYRYFWVLMNDLVFDDKSALKKLVDTMDAHESIGVISPFEPAGLYPDSKSKAEREFHVVATCDYLSLLVRGECIEKIGFLNPEFKYCWGAIHEFAHKLNKEGWSIAYSDKVSMKHLGGTTYGKVRGVISREEYQKNAKRFAARYFVERYGKRWNELFSKYLPDGVKIDIFKKHRQFWESALGKEKLSYQPYKRINDSLEERIKELHPWFYPVEIGGREIESAIYISPNGQKHIDIAPGIRHQDLKLRTEYREKILVTEVDKIYDFNNKSVLDLASNCGYWSSRYTSLGANKVTMVEGRKTYIDQGKLFWKHNKFLKDDPTFIQANVLDPELWDTLENQKFDFTLCCGILYHIPQYHILLRLLASVTREAILIDTRVSQNENLDIKEPGGFNFDSIVETREKNVPELSKINSLMKSLGYKVHKLKSMGFQPKVLQKTDNYETGQRVCLLCIKQ